MSYSVIPKPKLLHTGFLNKTDINIRQRQGLDSQNISNTCISSYLVSNSRNGNSHPVSYRSVSVCDPYNMYPVNSAYVNYGPSNIPSENCPCLRYLNSP